MNWIASKEYRSFVTVTSDLGIFTLENDLLKLEELSDEGKSGRYIFQNWEDSKDDV